MTWKWLCAALFCAVLYNGGSDTYTLIHGRVLAQQQATRTLQAWTDQYKVLAPVETAWEAAYPREAPKDLHEVLQLLDMEPLGLDVPSQLFTTTGTINPVQYNSQKLGIYQLCVQNGAGNAGLKITAIDYPTLFASLETLASRKNFSFTQINIPNSPTPTMTLASTCLLLKP
jgi:hypothetical protein